MSCATTQFPAFSFWDPHEKPHVVIGLSTHYNLQLEPGLGNRKVSIGRISFACIAHTTISKNKWAYGVEPSKQPR